MVAHAASATESSHMRARIPRPPSTRRPGTLGSPRHREPHSRKKVAVHPKVFCATLSGLVDPWCATRHLEHALASCSSDASKLSEDADLCTGGVSEDAATKATAAATAATQRRLLALATGAAAEVVRLRDERAASEAQRRDDERAHRATVNQLRAEVQSLLTKSEEAVSAQQRLSAALDTQRERLGHAPQRQQQQFNSELGRLRQECDAAVKQAHAAAAITLVSRFAPALIPASPRRRVSSKHTA